MNWLTNTFSFSRFSVIFSFLLRKESRASLKPYFSSFTDINAQSVKLLLNKMLINFL